MLFFAAAQRLLMRFVLSAVSALTAAAVVAIAMLAGAPSAHAAATDNVTGWAWSGTLGWISMNCTNTATCATSPFGVTMTETPGFADRADLSGYAWSESAGWICFGMTCAGTTPEGGSSYAQYRMMNNSKPDQFWGWAKIMNLGTEGWIALNCDKDVGADDCAFPYFIQMDNATGNFHVGMLVTDPDHWGWGRAADGKGAGWVDFSGVTTTWVIARLGEITRPSGVFEPQSSVTLPGTHLSTFTIKFTNFSATTGQLLECEIQRAAPPNRVVNKVLTSSVRNGTQTLDYTIGLGEPVQTNLLWVIKECRIAGSVLGAACANDAACPVNNICDENLGKCRSVIKKSLNQQPIYTHGNTWSGLSTLTDDQAAAVNCFQSESGKFFENTEQCDYTGDASFALAMRRGIPVEGICDDNVDNDGNGQTDCADRYCQGLAHICKTDKERLVCRYNQLNDNIIDCDSPTYVSGTQCCTQHPRVANIPLETTIVKGINCKYQDPKDGYFDCDCLNSSNNNAATGCYSPYYRRSTTSPAYVGDLCCNTSSEVTRF